MSKIEIKLNVGGVLQAGDVVGIALKNYTEFGWFVEAGGGGSLKYISFRQAEFTADQWDQHQKGTAQSTWYQKKLEKGLTFKTFIKDYILSFGPHDNRAFKIPNPEEFFRDAGDTEKQYLIGRKILNEVKFPAK